MISEPITLLQQFINLLNKLKCKLICCCKSTCSLNEERNSPTELETIPEI